jgi:hypothetical protein
MQVPSMKSASFTRTSSHVARADLAKAAVSFSDDLTPTPTADRAVIFVSAVHAAEHIATTTRGDAKLRGKLGTEFYRSCVKFLHQF